MKARIVTIGDEILIGQIIDTNSAWLATQLNAIGIRVESIYSISDTKEAIHKALDEAVGSVDLVLMTGGLGPTKDDITKQSLAEWFKSDWRVDENVLNKVVKHFEIRKIPMPEVNRDQAKVPSVCEVLTNEHGSAPGMWFEKDGTVLISMPGVPYEMKAIFSDEVVTRIQSRLMTSKIVHKTIMTQGIGESSLMEMITDWEESLKEHKLKLAYLPSAGLVRLRISGFESYTENVAEKIQQKTDELLLQISDFVFGFDDEKLEQVVGRLLAQHGLTVATAESCTGGYLSHMITSVPGSSAYYNGTAVTYSNEAKVNVLGVSGHSLDKVGAVSEEVAYQMAEGVRKLMNTDFAISTTGVAGPDGGTPEKPVGTVWIGISSPSRTYALKFLMGNHRERNIRRTALQALQLLRKEIMREKKLSLEDVLSRNKY